MNNLVQEQECRTKKPNRKNEKYRNVKNNNQNHHEDYFLKEPSMDHPLLLFKKNYLRNNLEY